MECQWCTNELLQAHEFIGICSWCLIKEEERQELVNNMPVPGYYSDVEETVVSIENDLPKAEEWM